MAKNALGRATMWLAGGVGAYAVLIGLLLTPPLQRLYSSFLMAPETKPADVTQCFVRKLN